MSENMLDRVETWVDNPMLGDTLVEATYNGYKDFGGAKFPTSIVDKQGGYPTLDLKRYGCKAQVPWRIFSLHRRLRRRRA